ncbi:hypothetical protein [Candidatus Methanoplasma termitum]|nr:hypothetical protein [Candidatus Methanoplasma termitum]MCL2334120.1 hypothetical protein [Candidatus Methanoplasma sp.]
MKGTAPDMEKIKERIENNEIYCLELDEGAGPGPLKITRYFFKDGSIESVILAPNFRAACPSCNNSWTTEDLIERLKEMPLLAYEFEMPGKTRVWMRFVTLHS